MVELKMSRFAPPLSVFFYGLGAIIFRLTCSSMRSSYEPEGDGSHLARRHPLASLLLLF